MGRPKKKGLDYFPHDTSAFFDEKIQALRQVYGNDGYTTYFVLLELIYKGGGYYNLKDKFTRILISLLNLTPERFEAIIKECVELGLFENDNELITSQRIQETINEINFRRNQWREQKKEKQKEEQKQELISEPETNSEKLINAFLRIFNKLPTMYERAEAEKLINEYGLEAVIDAMQKAKLQNKSSLAYIKGILTNKDKNQQKLEKIASKLYGSED